MALNTYFIVAAIVIATMIGVAVARPLPTSTDDYPPPPAANLRPAIGILTQPYSYPNGSESDLQYIASSYVKYIEAAGGIVIPIRYTISNDDLWKLLPSINGVLFPGGGADLDRGQPMTETARSIYHYATVVNNYSDYFPLWGTCMGFELMMVLASNASKETDVLSSFDAENITLPLEFTTAADSSRLFGSMTEDVRTILSTQPVTMNNHEQGVSLETFTQTPALSSYFKVLSVNKDRNNKVFVSTVEGYSYPFYASQWHPEKPQFEWTATECINHSYDAIRAMQSTANFFVQEARRSTRSFETWDELQAKAIFQYTPTYTGQSPSSSFQEIYLFSQ